MKNLEVDCKQSVKPQQAAGETGLESQAPEQLLELYNWRALTSEGGHLSW